MLRPYVMESPLAGVLATRLKPADIVNPGTLVAHIESGGKSNEVRAQVPGTVERWLVSDGATVAAGQPILSLSPNESMAWEALRALYLTGRPEDLPDVERFVRGIDGMSPQVAVQAQDTARAIRDRTNH
jgi:pyruvate/2-oxoglutarate dehydrogenase complex dihydrolipoamide acyltransferase (E2) component